MRREWPTMNGNQPIPPQTGDTVVLFSEDGKRLITSVTGRQNQALMLANKEQGGPSVAIPFAVWMAMAAQGQVFRPGATVWQLTGGTLDMGHGGCNGGSCGFDGGDGDGGYDDGYGGSCGCGGCDS